MWRYRSRPQPGKRLSQIDCHGLPRPQIPSRESPTLAFSPFATGGSAGQGHCGVPAGLFLSRGRCTCLRSRCEWGACSVHSNRWVRSFLFVGLPGTLTPCRGHIFMELCNTLLRVGWISRRCRPPDRQWRPSVWICSDGRREATRGSVLPSAILLLISPVRSDTLSSVATPEARPPARAIVGALAGASG